MGHAAGLRNRVARAREHFTVDRVSGSADLAVKFAAIIVAFGAVAVVFFGPNVELTSAHQTFIDEATQTSIVVWIAVAFFLLWLAIVLNDGRLRARAREADQPDARRASSE